MKLTFEQNIQLLQNHASAKDWRRLLTTCFPMPNRLYEAYLKSAAWKVKREARLAVDKNRCQGCMNCGFLDVHHKTYRNLGNEDVTNDLVSLCRTCHTSVHAGEALLLQEISIILATASPTACAPEASVSATANGSPCAARKPTPHTAMEDSNDQLSGEPVDQRFRCGDCERRTNHPKP